ncbi:hypothetical protein ScPMuIL_016135 [Solemya velum]
MSDIQENKNVRSVNDQFVQIDWAYRNNSMKASCRTNVVIAAYTTAQDRLPFRRLSSVIMDQDYNYSKSVSKQVLVTSDPVFVHRNVIDGRYLGKKPDNYIILACLVTILNPIIGPIAILFSTLSNKSYRNGDLKYALKWSNYSFTASILTFCVSALLYVAIGFALSPLGIKGGHAP